MHARPPHEAPRTSGNVIHWAPFYDAAAFVLTLGREKSIRRETVALAQVGPGQTVLDVGCGTGSLTLLARAEAGPDGRVCGIDPSPEMIDAAKKKAARAGLDIDFRVGVVEALGFPDASFDVVLSSLMLHHLPDNLKRAGFTEIARVLKPGGRLVAVDLAAGSHSLAGHLGAFLGHGHEPHSDATAPMLEAAGFTGIATGRMQFRALSFLRATRP